MACFVVSAAEAVVVTALQHHEARKEQQRSAEDKALTTGALTTEAPANASHIPMSRRLSWLSNMLWGGSALLAFEHVWHGEVTPWFPFLTAMNSAEDAAAMLHEMATAGVCMALLVTAAWFAGCKVADAIVARSADAENAEA